MFSIGLLNQSIDRLISRELDETLNRTIDSIRDLYNTMGNQTYTLISSNDISQAAKQKILKDYNVCEVLRIIKSEDRIASETLYIEDDFEVEIEPHLSEEEFANIISGELENTIIREEETTYFSYYKPIDSTQVMSIITPIEDEINQTIQNIEKQFSSYGLIFLIKEGIIRGRLVWGFGVIFVIILVLVSIYVARKLSKSITEPIGELSQSFTKVADGDLDIHLEVNAKDEVNLLIRSFNKMVRELSETQKKLLLSERIAAWRDVARQISHEIKNPLTPIQLSIHRLKKKIHFEKQDELVIEECFQTISEEVESLRNLATEFSEFARLPKPKLQKGGINEIIKSAVVLYETNEKNARFELNLTEDIPDILVDPELMKRVFINLIANSIDALKKNNDVIKIENSAITGDKSEKVVIVSVSDNGEGMTDEVLEKVFDPYFTTKKEGSGLGLPIIKRIMDEHKGTIFIESSPDEGTTIKLVLKAELAND